MPPAWVPSEGLIRDHFDYAVSATDAPPIYHVAAMLPIIASACADRATLEIHGTYYPLHVWMMLVGRSGSDRKTTATKLAVAPMESFISDRVQSIHGSPEGVLANLSHNPCAVLYAPEGGAFFAQRRAKYWEHAKEILMDLYDGPHKFVRTLAKKKLEIVRPRVSVLAAVAQPLLERYTSDTDWMGGFLARYLCVSGLALPAKPRLRRDRQREKHIRLLLENVFHTNWGHFTCLPKSRRILDDFADEVAELEVPAGLQPSVERLPDTAARVAALYEIARHANDRSNKLIVVTKESATCAVALCRACIQGTLLRIADLTMPFGDGRRLAKVESMVLEGGRDGVTRSRLLRRANMQAKYLDEIVDTLMQRDAIEEVIRVSAKGRRQLSYVHKEAERFRRHAEHDPITFVSFLHADQTRLDGLRFARES